MMVEVDLFAVVVGAIMSRVLYVGIIWLLDHLD